MERRYYINGKLVHIPNSSNLNISWSRERESIFFRKKLNGNPIVLSNCCDSEESFYEKILSEKPNICTLFKFEIKEFVDGVGWKSSYLGKFTPADCQYNEDIGEIGIKVNTDDRYDCLVKNWRVKYDVFGDINQSTFGIGTDPYTFDILVKYKSTTVSYVAPEIVGYAIIFSQADESYYDPQETGETNDVPWVTIYARLKHNTSLFPESYFENNIWYTAYDPLISARTLSVNGNPTIGGVWEEYIVDIEASNSAPEFFESFIINSAGYESDIPVDVQGWIKANDTINFLLDKIGCGNISGYQSDLLNNDINYVTGETDNPLKRLYFNDTSNVVNTGGQEATIFNLSLKDVFDAIEITVQGKVYIDGDVIRIEHPKKIYNVVDIVDLTSESKNYNIYDFDKAELPYIEEIETADQKIFIKYDNDCSSEETKTFNNKELYTNLSNMIGNDSISLDAIVVGVENLGVIDITYMQLDKLIPKYWTYERPFSSGLINDEVFFVADTVARRIKQNPFPYHLPNIYNFDQNSNYLTLLGSGRFDGATYELHTDTMKIKLKHGN